MNREEILSFLRVSSIAKKGDKKIISQESKNSVSKSIQQESINAVGKTIKTLQKLNIERVNLNRLEVEKELIDAYLSGFESAEAFLITKDPVLVRLIERTFIELRSYDHLSQHFSEKLQFLIKQLHKVSKVAGGQQKDINFQVSWLPELVASFTIIVEGSYFYHLCSMHTCN